MYLDTVEEEFKKRYYNHNKLFRNRSYANETALSKYVWEIKDKCNEMPSLKWPVKSVLGYSKISKMCLLCLHEMFEILNYPNQEELLNMGSELISKCCDADKYLLANYKSKDIVKFITVKYFQQKKIIYLKTGNMKLKVVKP